MLLSRLVEEAALLGVPSVVLDAGNDFARLAQPWPSRPTEFSDEDARKAKAYFERTEVTVWTPGVIGGRPLNLKPLPDFAALGGGVDAESLGEREAAVEMAVATLEPYLSGRGAAAIKLRGVLADTLRAFAQRGGGSLDGLVGMLASLPDGVSRIAEAASLAEELADQLAAAMAGEPMLRGEAAPFDPGQLFESRRGKTRVSVVNLSGLGGEAERRAFVNQLQMALFGWIKANPAPTGRLFVLTESQAYAPARETPACKRSALALIKQARKYGLGMIFATAEPRGARSGDTLQRVDPFLWPRRLGDLDRGGGCADGRQGRRRWRSGAAEGRRVLLFDAGVFSARDDPRAAVSDPPRAEPADGGRG